jgi:hypothetical protein
MALVAFPPPFFAGSISVLWFHLFPPPPRGNTSGGLYIGLLRLRQSIWDKDGRHRRHDGQTDLGGMAWPARATWSHLILVAPSCASSSHFVALGKIITPEKTSLRLSSKRSIKRKNTQNRCFLFCKVITQIRGIN